MNDHIQRFTGRAEAYERYRQRYPSQELAALLREWCGLRPEWLVADIGAGTGMLTEVFLANGNRTIAVEPNEQMRAACEGLRERWPELEVIDATAEATGLADSSVEMVAAGRAFHWFDTQAALGEFRRILKPGGWVTLVSAGRAHIQTEQALAFDRLLVEFGIDHTYARSTYRIHDKFGELFADLQQEEIPGEQLFGWNDLEGYAQSLSVVPQRGAWGFERFHAELRKYFDAYAQEGVLRMQTTCWVSAGRVSTR